MNVDPVQSFGQNFIIGGDGDDTILVSGNGNYIEGGAGNDKIYFWGDNNTIDGGDGNDVIISDDSLKPAGESKTSTQKVTSQTTSTSSNQTSTTSGSYRYTTTNTYENTNTYETTIVREKGVENNVIKGGKGEDTIIVSGINNTLDGGAGNDIIQAKETKVISQETKLVDTNTKLVGSTTTSTYIDPIILDIDKDGIVEATAGMGIDLDGDGIADGAATGGDKMLAMSDLNGNGIIDGAEVFGDQTINPFTGQKVSAKNGFEALKEIALSAEAATGLKIYKDGQVDVRLLKQALESKGLGTIGLIGDNNNTTLEDLGDVAAINVDDYINSENETGDVQHRQRGTYTDTSGNKWGAHDVWFVITRTFQSAMEFIENLYNKILGRS